MEGVPLIMEKLRISDDSSEDEIFQTKATSLSVAVVTVMLIAGVTGAGCMTLPRVIADTGWAGLLLLTLVCIGAAYTAVLLGECWNIVVDRYPECRAHVRNPYPVIGEKAFGIWMRRLISVMNNTSLFMITVVYTLLVAQTLQALLKEAGLHISFCYWLLVLAIVLVPLSWLGSPQDFWPVSVVAFVTILVTIILVIVGSLIHVAHEGVAWSAPYHPTFKDYSLTLGTIAFSFAGSIAFPNIQHDMANPKKFSVSVAISYSVIFTLYVVSAVSANAAYGQSVDTIVLMSLTPRSLYLAAQAFFISHILAVLDTYLIPLAQDFESLFGVPRHFTWKRCVIRTTLVGMAIFVGESVPRFFTLQALVGGSTLCLGAYVVPCILYWKLCSQKGDWTPRTFPWYHGLLCVLVPALGILGGAATVWSALEEIFADNTFVPPCYCNITAASQN